jgi:hypothetical protein
VNLLINGVNVIPLFSGISGGAGQYQINLFIPAGLGAGDVPLVATVGGAQTPSGVVISLQSAITPQIQNLTLSANSVASGGTATGIVAISAGAPSGGAVVGLSSSSSAASVPATVTVPAEATSATTGSGSRGGGDGRGAARVCANVARLLAVRSDALQAHLRAWAKAGVMEAKR